MKDSKLFASVSLFKELYDNNKDIYDVIAEFIKAAVILEGKNYFNSMDILQSFEKLFDFKIPEAVIKTTLKID